MKKYIAYILLTCLLLSCFAGCKQDNITSTDVTPLDTTPIESVDETVTQQPDNSVDNTVVDESKVASKAAASPSETKKDHQETQSKVEQNKPSADDIHGMPALKDNPTFVSENAFKTWLTKGSGQFEEDRNTALQQAANQKFIYYRPSGDFSQYGSLTNIEYSATHQKLTYWIYQNKAPSVEISVYCMDSGWDEIYDKLYSAGPDAFKHITYDGIEYHYFNPKETLVIWEQFGTTHIAGIHQNKDQVEDIIPLLKLEQVTVPLNSDHVTQ